MKFKEGDRVTHASRPGYEGTVVRVQGSEVVVRWDDKDYEDDVTGSWCYVSYLRPVSDRGAKEGELRRS